MIRRTFRAISTLAALAGTVAAALYRDRAAHAEEREDAAHDLVSEAIADKQKAWTELGLMRDRAERAERDLTIERRRSKLWKSSWERLDRNARARIIELDAKLHAAVAKDSEPRIERATVPPVTCTWCRRLREDTGGIIGHAGATLPVCGGCKHDTNATSKNILARHAVSHLPECGECNGKGWYFPAGEPGRNYAECGSCGQTGHLAARARIAELEQDSAPVEPAAVDAVARCAGCDSTSELYFATRATADLDSEVIRFCMTCNMDPDMSIDAIRARYAARAAQAVAAAVEPAADEEWGMHMKPTSPDEEDDAEPAAPTQDDLDDAAVRELLARGPATWDEIFDAIPGDWKACARVISNMGLVCDVADDEIGGRYSLPAPEASK